jgi:hypothetical protein
MPNRADKRRGGVAAVVIIVAIVVAIFAGYNLWYLSGHADNNQAPTTQR